MIHALATIPAALILTASVAAHGAIYQPPPPDVPAGKSGIPDPGTGPTYGGSPVFPGTPGPGAPGTPGAGSPSTLGGFGAGIDRTRWTWWWEFHKAPYLDLKRHVLGGDPISGEDGFLGRGTGSPPLLVPTPEVLRNKVLPPLLRILQDERGTDLLSSTLLAAARIADDLEEADRETVADAIRPFLRDKTHELSEAAVLALGILGHEPSTPHLAALLRDDAFGRALLGQKQVRTRLRAIAAYALGLLGETSDREDVRRYIVHELSRTLELERKSPLADLEAACVLGLGLVPLRDVGALPEDDEVLPASASRAAQLTFLEEILFDKRRDDFVRAQVPLSMARLCIAEGANAATLRERAATTLTGRLAPMRREPNSLVQSAVVALGLLADNDDDPGDIAVRRALFTIDSDHSDQGARHFARIALARIAAREGTGEPKGLADTRRFLLKELARGSTQERPWAALGLGVLERGRIEAGRIPNGEVASALRSALTDARSPDEVGAYAIAIGLVRDASAEVVLTKSLISMRDDEARGQLALALGMIGARGASLRLNHLVDNSLYRPLLLREAATGLALLSEKDAVPRLLGFLRDARALSSQAALAQAIGRVGDARTLEPLVAMLQDDSITDGARAFVAVAIGLAGDLDPLPWTAPLAVHGNHLAAPATLYDDVGLGVLNLL